MPCGRKPLVKKWDKPKILRTITASPYEQNEASVKVHWRKVIRDLELSYKDDKFWESQRDIVHRLVGPAIFRRLEDIFKLPADDVDYKPVSESSLQPSDLYYALGSDQQLGEPGVRYSMSDYKPSSEEATTVEEESDWTESDETVIETKPSRFSKSLMKSKSSVSKTFASRYNISKVTRLSATKSVQSRQSRRSSSPKSKRFSQALTSMESPASTGDDLIVQDVSIRPKNPSSRSPPSVPTHERRCRAISETKTRTFLKTRNPHFDMLYCNESETDMIKWNSKYKKKAFEISASDEFSKKAEIITKQISKAFYDWWVGLGNEEFKSEIKRPEDIEDLFQVLFDEHASRGLVLDPKILPCVIPSIAKYVGVPKAACPSVLKRQIAFDINAETRPAHTEAFGTCLPHKLKHISPTNDTAKMWHSLVIPEDLNTMSAIWGDISYLTSTKAFHAWLQKRPHLPMAKYLRSLDFPGDKKQPFVVPSDFILGKDKSAFASESSVQELALPVSEFTMELKEVLSQIMND